LESAVSVRRTLFGQRTANIIGFNRLLDGTINEAKRKGDSKMEVREAIHKYAVMIGISAFAFAYSLATANAFQSDEPFLAHQEKNKDKWAQEDKIINEKLAALEQKFGKKPNIIYICQPYRRSSQLRFCQQ
jgi:hypothetical protein